MERDEDVHIERGDGLQVEGRADCAADGVALDDAVGLHLVDGGDDVPDVHAAKVVFNSSSKAGSASPNNW